MNAKNRGTTKFRNTNIIYSFKKNFIANSSNSSQRDLGSKRKKNLKKKV